jgi:TonB family protein
MAWRWPILILSMLFSQSPEPVRLWIAPVPRATISEADTALVLLDGEINPCGEVDHLKVNQGTAAFVEPSLESVRQWQFERPDDQISIPVSAVLLFRARTDLAHGAYEFSVPVNSSASTSTPQPTTIIGPNYPLDSAAEGTVILQLQVNDQGRVEKADVINEVPSLTSAAIAAVFQWRFRPAFRNGTPTAGVTVAVIFFPRPTQVF